MSEHKLANGGALTDEDIERISSEFEGETWSGRLEHIHQGPAAVSGEPLNCPPSGGRR